jgi:diguanylate cyclase (GGDEF)-like protein
MVSLSWLRLVTLLIAVLIWMPSHAAGNAVTEALEIDRMVQRNPRQAAAEAQLILAQANAKDDKPMQLRALRILANARSLLGNMFVLGEDIALGEQLARELGNNQAKVEFLIARGDEMELLGQFVKADKKYSEALSLSQKAQLPLAIAMSYAAMVNSSLDRGVKTNVIFQATKAYGLFEAQSDLRGMAQMLAALGLHSNDSVRTIEYLERANDLSDPAIYRWDAMMTNYYLGAALYRNKDYKKAEMQLQKALKGAITLAIPNNIAYIQYYLGQVSLAEKRFSQALSHWDLAVTTFASNNDLPALFETQRFRADALSALDRKSDSASALAQAQLAAEKIRMLGGKAKNIPRSSRIQAPFSEYQTTYQEMLNPDSQNRIDISAKASAAVAEARFDAKLRETENLLMREQRKGSEMQRLSLVLALLGSVAILMLALYVLIRQIRQKRRFANLAMRDELTGLRNRRSILEYARVQFRMRTTLGTRLFVAILDLDHFKKVNDQYGHDVGDAVLVAFANACQRHLRSNHVFGRFGGEEFLLVMADTREDQVFDIFERLREIVGDLEVSGLPTTHRLSFSMGSAEVKNTTSSLESLIKEADLALYRAKEKGRDRCEIHQGGLQAIYDTNIVRARPTGHAPLAYEPATRLQSVKIANGALDNV